MTRKRWLNGLIGLGMLSIFVTACDDGGGDALTPEEAEALARLIGEASIGPVLGETVGAWTPGGPAPTAHAGGTKEYDFDKSCSGGGSVNLAGKADYDFGETGGTVQIEGAITFDDCAEETGDGVTYTLNGGIDHLIEAVISVADGVFRIEADGSASGSVAWKNEDDGGSGVCEVDVTIDVTVEVDKEAGTWDLEGGLTGTVCGIAVEAGAKDWLKGWK